jgi:thiosulfate reductase cytochrome b subunit
MKKVYLYKGFERFWHWAQTLLIFALIFTGFEIHGTTNLIDYEIAVTWHNFAAWAFAVLIVFAVFWHLTTKEWRNYIPTMVNMRAQINYYLIGIFKHAPHPTRKRTLSKLNPLQRLVYFGLKILLIPLMIFSGFVYYFFNYPIKGFEISSLETVAYIHTIGAYALISFVIIHLYLITTGRTLTSNLYAMITGWEVMDEEEIRDIVEEAVDETGMKIKPVKNDKTGHDEVKELMVNALKDTENKLKEDKMDGQKKIEKKNNKNNNNKKS